MYTAQSLPHDSPEQVSTNCISTNQQTLTLVSKINTHTAACKWNALRLKSFLNYLNELSHVIIWQSPLWRDGV
jgi:hypothetical protein